MLSACCVLAVMAFTVRAQPLTFTKFAGPVGGPGSAYGTGSAARFDSPNGVATDSGNIYVADAGTKRSGSAGQRSPTPPRSTLPPVPLAPRFSSTPLPRRQRAGNGAIVRRPSGSTATLFSTSIRNPLLTPDVADLYTFQLTASNGVNTLQSTWQVKPDGKRMFSTSQPRKPRSA
jgi:hypothetical protein